MASHIIWNIEELLQRHGQECVDELLDLIIIVKNPSNEIVRNWLLKYHIIKPTTKKIYAYIYTLHENIIGVRIYNGRHQTIICMSISL